MIDLVKSDLKETITSFFVSYRMPKILFNPLLNWNKLGGITMFASRTDSCDPVHSTKAVLTL